MRVYLARSVSWMYVVTWGPESAVGDHQFKQRSNYVHISLALGVAYRYNSLPTDARSTHSPARAWSHRSSQGLCKSRFSAGPSLVQPSQSRLLLTASPID